MYYLTAKFVETHSSASLHDVLFNRKICRDAQQCVFTNHRVHGVFRKFNKVLYAVCLREGLKWKAHSPTKEVRGLAMKSLTKGGTTNGHAIII